MDGLMQVRDLTIWKWTTKEWLVFATDNLAGIGERPYDEFAATPEDVGYFTARVALFELLASGTTPKLVIDTVSVGGTYGKRTIAGIREAVQEAGLPATFPITGSCEDNMSATVTALGVTAIGQVSQAAFRPGTVRAGDEVWLVGMPKSAPHDHVFRGDRAIVSFSQLHTLLSMDTVREILPVGSRGAMFEAQQLAATAGLRFLPQTAAAKGIAAKSGGPATVVLAAGRLSNDSNWNNVCKQIPCLYLGILEG